MCTALSLKKKDFYFGRNLDLEYSFNESVVITTRNYFFNFKTGEKIDNHEAIIGMATIVDDYPLYAEACNESGLCISGLNFPGNAVYHEEKKDALNIASYELIPYILTKYKNIKELKKDINKFNILKEAFKLELGTSPLHWIICDKEESIVLESVKEGLKIYDNPLGILTNNPGFDFHMEYIKHFINISPNNPKNNFSKNFDIKAYGQGFGMIGIPGDNSPASRFIKTAFLKENSICEDDENSCVSQFFHILDSVSMIRGSTITDEGKYDITRYNCCINTDKMIYYYKTYDNSRINAISLYNEELDSNKLINFELNKDMDILFIN